MFEIVITFMTDFINLIPGLLVLYFIFDFIGSFLFGNR